MDDEAAAELRVEPGDDDLDIMALGPEEVETLTPEIIGTSFLPVVKAAFERNPDAANYLDFTSSTPRAGTVTCNVLPLGPADPARAADEGRAGADRGAPRSTASTRLPSTPGSASPARVGLTRTRQGSRLRWMLSGSSASPIPTNPRTTRTDGRSDYDRATAGTVRDWTKSRSAFGSSRTSFLVARLTLIPPISSWIETRASATPGACSAHASLSAS